MTVDAGPVTGRMLSVEEALQRLVDAVPALLPVETAALEDALGRVLAEPVTSGTDLPPWDNSAMDGYAVIAEDVAGATLGRPVELALVGEVRAGEAPSETVRRRTAMRIATGAPLPPGADAVVPVEDTTPIDAAGRRGERGRDALGPVPDRCLVHVPATPGQHVRHRADDLAAGDVVLAANRRLAPAEIALAAGVGKGTVAVRRRPRVGVLSTGDELRRPGEPLGPAGIPDANRPGVIALLRAAGAEPLDLGIARDEMPAVLAALRPALERCDAVVVTGGVSVGPYDVVRGAFGTLGRVELWRVAVQPGKPFAFATADGPRGPVLLFGLPGNPVSTFITFELFVRTALDRMLGLVEPAEVAALTALRGDRGILLDPVRKAADRRAFIRVAAERNGPTPARDGLGRVRLRLAGAQGSHVLSSLAAADGLAVIPETTDHLDAGSEVELRWLDH